MTRFLHFPIVVTAALVLTLSACGDSGEKSAKSLHDAANNLANAQSFTLVRVENAKAVETANYEKPDKLKYMFPNDKDRDRALTAIVIGDEAWSQKYMQYPGQYVQSSTDSGKALIAEQLKKVQALQNATNVKSKGGYLNFDVAGDMQQNLGFKSGRARVADGSIGEVHLVDLAGTDAQYQFQNIGRLTEVSPPPAYTIRIVEPANRCSVLGSAEDKLPC